MITRRALLVSAAALPLGAALSTTAAHAAEPPVYATNGIAINGIDRVGYFLEERPIEGDMAHAVDWDGAKLLFASAENMEMFQSDPERFAPKYGGYCAYAVSKGYTATTDPKAWSIHNDRLYLNYSRPVRALWALDKDGHIASANANWPGVLG